MQGFQVFVVLFVVVCFSWQKRLNIIRGTWMQCSKRVKPTRWRFEARAKRAAAQVGIISWHKHLKNIIMRRKAVSYDLSYHCVGNWHIGAPSVCRRPCLLRRCRAQQLCDKEKGVRGTCHHCVFPNGTDMGGNGGSTVRGLKSLLKPAGLCVNHTEERDRWAALPQHCMRL